MLYIAAIEIVQFFDRNHGYEKILSSFYDLLEIGLQIKIIALGGGKLYFGAVKL